MIAEDKAFGESDEDKTDESNKAQELRYDAIELDVNDALEGSNSGSWKKAITSEVESHKLRHLGVNRQTRDKNIIESKTVLKNELKGDRTLKRRKARILARGFAQRLLCDYFKTFTAVTRLDLDES